MSERTDISFDAALMMHFVQMRKENWIRFQTPKQFEEIYPDTSQWDERMTEALKKKKHQPSVETSTNCGIDTRNADGWCSCGQR